MTLASVIETVANVSNDGYIHTRRPRDVVSRPKTTDGIPRPETLEALLFHAADPAHASNSGAQPPEPATIMRRIQRMTGLDWRTIAATLGVTRRSVHHWLAGGPISPENVRRVQRFASELAKQARAGENADQLRQRLTAQTAEGTSLLGLVRASVLKDAPTPHRNSPSPLALLGEATYTATADTGVGASDPEMMPVLLD